MGRNGRGAGQARKAAPRPAGEVGYSEGDQAGDLVGAGDHSGEAARDDREEAGLR
jgi:hypothetical protein